MEADPGEGLTATPGSGPAALRLVDCRAALLKIAWDAPTCAAPLIKDVIVTWRAWPGASLGRVLQPWMAVAHSTRNLLSSQF